MAGAYFDGEVGELRTAFLDATGLPASSWEAMIAGTRDERWALASLSLFPAAVA